ncbi:hypothetical protein [Hoeflea poritis]|uniref:Carboxypeptidase regulatory-like domain-containing protein n=1 Tax=Hoeflea poritis TaxID=2993659 RepID=A0ABT4VJG1_9HYPH|nr:hypothetical protein [Hoeflea poritis]MDA4844842.1 hypothetical protein [Hoeflea poritis]
MPLPHITYIAPLIVGTVKDGDKVLADVEVELAAFRGDTKWAKSDESGAFQIGPIAHTELFVMLGADHFSNYTLYIKYEGKKYKGSSGPFGHEPIYLECDISKRESIESPQGLCELMADNFQ